MAKPGDSRRLSPSGSSWSGGGSDVARNGEGIIASDLVDLCGCDGCIRDDVGVSMMSKLAEFCFRKSVFNELEAWGV